MGYIKLFRKIQDWGWYDDPNTLALWVHLLVDANWKDNAEWHGEPIERGALITSVAKISADTGLSDRQVRTALSHLVSTGEIVMKATNKWTKITVCKYDTYQPASTDECQADDEQATSRRQAGDKQPTTLKESNKGKKKEGKNIYAEAVDRIYNLYPSMTTRADGTKSSLRTAKKDKDKIERLLASGEYTEESLSNAIRRYLSETKPEYLKLFQTFLNQVPDYGEADSQPTTSPQVSPAPSSKEADMKKATNPTREEIEKRYRTSFLPFYPPNEGESKEAYNERIRPFWERFYKNWIDDRVQAVNNKY